MVLLNQNIKTIKFTKFDFFILQYYYTYKFVYMFIPLFYVAR